MAGNLPVTLAPDLFQGDEIAAELAGEPRQKTDGRTPTAKSLDVIREHLAGVDGDRYVALVTDGAPNCNSSLDGSTCLCTVGRWVCEAAPSQCIDDDEAVRAVTDLRMAGIPSYVIGYDSEKVREEYTQTLDRMAAAGGTERDTYIPVSDKVSLEAALDSTIGAVIPCTYELEEPPGDIRFVRVTLDGTQVDHVSVHGTGNGWELGGDRTVELRGNVCERLKDGEPHELEIVVECEPVII